MPLAEGARPARWLDLARAGIVAGPALFLVALAVRLYGLTYHSLWFDEVMSTFWAARPAGEIWRVGLALTEDKHPPLYYLLLHGWTVVFGPGDVAVRTLGVLLGALAVLPAYGIGRALGGPRAGVFTALLLALNPFLVWYSQEARMFMPATTFCLAGLYGLLLIYDVRWGRSSPGRAERGRGVSIAAAGLLLCVLGFSAALYTYLFSAFLLPVAGAWLAVLAWLDRRQPGAPRRLAMGACALLVVGLLFIPLARSAWSVSSAESEPGRAFAGMWPALAGLLRVYAVGWPHWPQPWPAVITAGAGVLAALGVLLSPRYPQPSDDGRSGSQARALDHGAVRRAGGLLLGLWLGLPLLIGGLLLARDRTVFAESRYFIFLVPALCMAWGRALVGLGPLLARPETPPPRSLAAFLAVVAPVVVVLAVALSWNWRPENRREAWREAAAFVAAHAGPHDAVVVQADYVHLAFERYFSGPQPVFYPFTGPVSGQEQVDGPLSGLAGYDAVWLVQSHGQDLDPGNLIAGWFGARFPQVTEVFPPGIAIRGFAQHYRTPALPAAAAEVPSSQAVPGWSTGVAALPAGGVALGDLRLLGCVYMPASLAARDDLYHPPSGWVHVTTYWTAAGPLPQDLSPTVRLVDGAGQVWGERLDGATSAFRVWPTSRWLPGEVVRADDDVNLNPVTPAGSYRLIAGVTGAGDATCGEITIR